MDWQLKLKSCQRLEVSTLWFFEEDCSDIVRRLLEDLVFDGMHQLRLTDAFFRGNKDRLSRSNSIGEIVKSSDRILDTSDWRRTQDVGELFEGVNNSLR